MDTSKCQYPAPGPWKNKVSSNTLFLEGVFYFIGGSCGLGEKTLRECLEGGIIKIHA